MVANRIEGLRPIESASYAGIAKTVRVNEFDYSVLKSIQPEGKRKSVWDFAFNVDTHGEIFPVVRSGHTPEAEREYFRGMLPVLDQVADAAVEVRGEPGRFFVNRNGVFYKDRSTQLKQCVRFDMTPRTTA